MNTILSLDLGTATGWAVTTQDGSITSGTESFKPHRFEGGGMRYLRFKRWLTEVNSMARLDAVYFEEVRHHAGVDAAHAYGGFMAHLTAWCEHHRIPYQGVPVGTIKKHVTGKGNSDKAAMMVAVQAKGYTPTDDNEADAIALLLWAIERSGDGSSSAPPDPIERSGDGSSSAPPDPIERSEVEPSRPPADPAPDPDPDRPPPLKGWKATSSKDWDKALQRRDVARYKRRRSPPPP
jgi:Holliday junction resolvasome RuvABC endonuclease subunit